MSTIEAFNTNNSKTSISNLFTTFLAQDQKSFFSCWHYAIPPVFRICQFLKVKISQLVDLLRKRHEICSHFLTDGVFSPSRLQTMEIQLILSQSNNWIHLRFNELLCSIRNNVEFAQQIEKMRICGLSYPDGGIDLVYEMCASQGAASSQRLRRPRHPTVPDILEAGSPEK
jgi:hypothetical protein